ncbi:MAG: ankyrin repeat domain-containing protein [Deltaproteobacteria bacterium]|nr:ankyrin repeat domain-containing protein [Deltaproteobacteria bacterium]
MAAKTRFVLRCPGCRAPLADSLKSCPYCRRPTTFAALGLHGGLSSDGRGGLKVEDGAHLVLGGAEAEKRDCPFCGAQVRVADRFCSYCKAKVVIETLWLRSLEVSNGGRVTLQGAQLRIGVPGLDHGLRDAALAGDVERVRRCLDEGAELDGVDDQERSALHHAVEAGHEKAALYLLSMGADVTGKDSEGETALHLAATRGMEKLVAALVAEGARCKARNCRKRTPADCAAAAGHADLAKLLAF